VPWQLGLGLCEWLVYFALSFSTFTYFVWWVWQWMSMYGVHIFSQLCLIICASGLKRFLFLSMLVIS